MIKTDYTNLCGNVGEKPEYTFLVDLAWILHKNYNAMKKITADVDGEDVVTGHFFGTSRLVQTMLMNYNCRVFLCTDSLPKDKHSLLEAYKADRPEAQFSLKEATIEVCKMNCAYPGVYAAVLKETEADELMYALSRTLKGEKMVILSGDNDLLQAINDRVSVARKVTKAGIEYVDQAYVDKTFGVPIDKVLFYRLMAGDVSDKIPGMPLMKKGRARELAKKFKSLREVLEWAKRNQVGMEMVVNIKLMKLKVVNAGLWKSTKEEAREVALKYNIRSALNMIDTIGIESGVTDGFG